MIQAQCIRIGQQGARHSVLVQEGKDSIKSAEWIHGFGPAVCGRIACFFFFFMGIDGSGVVFFWFFVGVLRGWLSDVVYMCVSGICG